MRLGIFMAAMAMTIGGHAAEPPAGSSTPTPQAAPLDPLFDCFHMNTAWGFALAGAMIDRQGRIYRYSLRGKGWAPVATQTDGMMYFRDTELRAKFAQAQRSGSVDAKALAENSALIAKAAEGKLERTDTGARDAGTSTCHAYIHDEARQRYRDVELGSDGGVGDMRDVNGSTEAQSLLAWLKTLGVAR